MKEKDDLPIDDRAKHPADVIDRYLGGETVGDEAATFARCDAVIALTPKLAASADVAWAFDEARELARSDPRERETAPAMPGLPSRWLLNPGVAWGAAGVLAVALFIALMPRGPNLSGNDEFASGEGAARQATPMVSTTQTSEAVEPPTIQNFTFAPIVVSTELAQALAEVRPVVLLADQTAAIYAGSDLTATEIAQQLGVRGILEGNVDSINGNILFSLNFTDAATAGSSINRSLERPTAEAAYLQSDIASSVLDALARTPPPDPLEAIL